MIVSTTNLTLPRKTLGVRKVAFRLDRLKKLRKAQKMTQKDLAKLIGVSSKSISNYEKGLASPDGENLVRLADALGSNAYYLTGRTNWPGPLTDLHFQVWERFMDGDQNGLLDLMRKHLLQKGLGKKPISRHKPSSTQ